jgi:hypothetical protein
MKKLICRAQWVACLIITFNIFSCKKSDSAPTKSAKYQIVTGDWAQSDIVLGVPVSVKVSGVKYSFPLGTSVITNPYMKAFGVAAQFSPTSSNVYHFTDAGAYSIDGVTSLILPIAGSSGKWSLDVYDAVLKLAPAAADTTDPHWISGLAQDSMALSMTVNITGLGTAPLTLILKRS